MIEENEREVRNELLALNIWWNLNILRDIVRKEEERSAD